jgi:hypothetical protein
VFVAIIWSNQIKRGRSYYVFQKAVNCELDVPVPNLPGMCELAIFYTLYFILAKCDLASWAIVDVGNNKVVY